LFRLYTVSQTKKNDFLQLWQEATKQMLAKRTGAVVCMQSSFTVRIYHSNNNASKKNFPSDMEGFEKNTYQSP